VPSPSQPNEASRLMNLGPRAASCAGSDRAAILTGRSLWLAATLLGALAVVIRLPGLGRAANMDELYHFLAAQAWLEEGKLRIAEGFYDRASLFTIFIGEWLGLFGENILVARLPSLIAGTALVVLVFLWTRAVAGALAAVLAGLLVALDPEAVERSQLIRFYAWQCLFFWFGAVGTYRLVTSPPPGPARTVLLAAATVTCFGAALYLQLTTLIGLLGVAVWAALALGLPWLAKSSHQGRLGVIIGMALLGAAAIWALMETGIAGELLGDYRNTPLFQAEHRDAFWYYHAFLVIYYPSLWPLTALAVVIGLAYRPRPTAFCASVVAIAFVLHSFAGPKSERYLTYAHPFLFVLWAIALAEVWPRLRGFLEDVGGRTLAWLRLGRLGRSGVFALLAVVLGFAIAANGALVRTMANVFDIVIPPMKKPADWAAAKEPLAPWLADAAIVLTTGEIEALYYLGRYDVLISASRLSEIQDDEEFSLDGRTGRPVITTPESLALIMDCYPDGLIVSSASLWRDPARLDDAVADLVTARAEEVKLPAFGMKAYVWRQPDDARRVQACARLPSGLGNDVLAGLGRNHAP
jgi:hypothetical protein